MPAQPHIEFVSGVSLAGLSVDALPNGNVVMSWWDWRGSEAFFRVFAPEGGAFSGQRSLGEAVSAPSLVELPGGGFEPISYIHAGRSMGGPFADAASCPAQSCLRAPLPCVKPRSNPEMHDSGTTRLVDVLRITATRQIFEDSRSDPPSCIKPKDRIRRIGQKTIAKREDSRNLRV